MLQKILQSNNTCKWRMNSTLSEKNQSYTVWHRANWHISECNFVLRCKFRGQSLHAEEEITSCHFKTSSVTMDQWIMWCVHGQQTAVSHIGHPMDRTVTIPHGSGLLPSGIFWKTVYTGIAHTHTHTIQELNHAIQDEIVTIYQELSHRYYSQFLNCLQCTANEGGKTNK